MQQKLHPRSLIALNAQKLRPIALKSNTYIHIHPFEKTNRFKLETWFESRARIFRGLILTNRYCLDFFYFSSSFSFHLFHLTRFDLVTDRVTLKINHVIFGAPIFFLYPRASLFKVFHSLFSFFSRRIIVEWFSRVCGSGCRYIWEWKFLESRSQELF